MTPFQETLEELFQNAKDSPYLQKVRDKAWETLQARGLPTRKDETFRYVPLSQLYQHHWKPSQKQTVSPEKVASLIYPECQRSHIVLIDGQYQENLSCFPKNVHVQHLDHAFKTFGSFLQHRCIQDTQQEVDAFSLINTALHDSGLFIYLPPKAILESPLQILNLFTTTCFPRIHIFAGTHSECSLYYHTENLSLAPPLVNMVTDYSLEDSAKLRVYSNHDGHDNEGWFFESVRALVKKNSSFETCRFGSSTKYERSDYHVKLLGENGEALLRGICLLNDSQQSHTNILMEHIEPHCHSKQFFKNVLNDSSRSSFSGKIYVHSKAQKTDAFQLNNNLLLSDNAIAATMPNLEIFADDVKASHGATVGQLDTEQLFYLQSRGVPKHQARALLIGGFLQEILDLVPLLSLRSSLKDKLLGNINNA